MSKNKFFKLMLSSCCDPVKMDFNVGKYCSSGVIWKDFGNSVRCVDNLWEYILAKEKKAKAF